MGTVSIDGSSLGNALQQLLLADDLVPGADASYQLCKTIYVYHPLGSKIVEAPIEAAQSQKRKISVPKGPEERLREAFERQWEADGCDQNIFSTAVQARIYGLASLAMLTDGAEPETPIDFAKLAGAKIGFNVFDPLNTAGSLVLNQDPNSIDFQKHAAIRVGGKVYHRSRSVTIMNERPLYIEYTNSAFGFVGRSAYQRALFPLKSFVQTMVTDDMVSKKAGLIIAFIKGAGSIVDNLMAKFAGIKRSLLKVAVVDNVLSMGDADRVESLNLQNLDGAFGNSRSNILRNIATAVPMPAVMLENETLTEGFGEGTEDAKIISRYVAGRREWMAPLYAFLDPIVRRRAWNPEFFAALAAEFPDELAGKTYDVAFGEWEASFVAVWPPLLEEPESEKIKVEDVKFRALIATAEVLGPQLDPENKAKMFMWLADNLNEHKLLFGTPLELDWEALAEWTPPEQMTAPGGNPVDEKLDSLGAYRLAVTKLPLRLKSSRKVG